MTMRYRVVCPKIILLEKLLHEIFLTRKFNIHDLQYNIIIHTLQYQHYQHYLHYSHTHTPCLCTANQETMVELVSFFQRSLPEELLTPPSRTTTQLTTPTSSQEREDSGLNEVHNIIGLILSGGREGEYAN